jgi:spore germination cell wall hydrolase CwlJ-like protein
MTRRKEIKALSATDPRYQDAARIADAVLSGDVPDPTEGATHFLNPDIVRKRRGGSLPAWAHNGGQSIGRHTFYAPYHRSATQQASLLFALGGGKSSC